MLCYTKLAFEQIGEFEQDLTTLSIASEKNFICKSFWQEELNSNNEIEIYLDAPRLYKGRGRLIELTDDQLSSNQYSFKSFVRLSMSQRDHEVFETIDIPIGVYELQVHAKNDRPGPVEINVYAEQLPIGTIYYDKDDGSWETKSLLLQPIHWNNQNNKTENFTIRITFANAAPKRVANLAWLRITPISSNLINE